MGASISQVFKNVSSTQPLAKPESNVSTKNEIPLPVAGPNPISKNQQKKLRRQKQSEERKKRRKEKEKAERAKRKAEKRAEREEKWSKLSEKEKEEARAERLKLIRAERKEDKDKRKQIRLALENNTKFSICIDLDWNDQMLDKERKSLARQLAYSYNVLRKCVCQGQIPMALSVSGIDDVIRPVLDFAASGWETWPIKMSENHLLDLHERHKLVYLTHDAEEVLQSLDPEAVYVIGGIVDRNRLVGATVNKARRLGLKTARLNIDANVLLDHGTKVLTINHCVEILVQAANGLSWKEAYLKVLPVRKGVQLSG